MTENTGVALPQMRLGGKHFEDDLLLSVIGYRKFYDLRYAEYKEDARVKMEVISAEILNRHFQPRSSE